MLIAPAHLEHLPTLLRSECIFLQDDACFERVALGWMMLCPQTPDYWWGNALFMDHAPEQRDVELWPRAFANLVQQRQPSSRHMAFGWEGDSAGAADDFARAGFTFFGLVTLSASHLTSPNQAAPDRLVMRGFQNNDWSSLVDLMTAERDPRYAIEAYRTFALGRTRTWQSLAQRDQGNYFGAFNGSELIAALGLFVEAEADRKGRRLARFQQVLTAQAWRNRGVASSLLATAFTSVALRYAPSEFLIQAESLGTARRIYQKLGFEPVSLAYGIERAPDDVLHQA